MNIEEQLQLINDSSLDIIYSYDRQGRFTSVNTSFCQIMKLPVEKVIGKTHAELGFPEAQCREWAELHERVYATNATVTSPTTSVMPDGKIHFFEVVLNPLHNAEGEIIGIAGTTRDITERLKAEQELIRMNEEILRNNERLESLVRVTQHQASSVHDLLEYALNEAIALTRSKIGYLFNYCEKDQLFKLNVWSKEVMNDCVMLEPQTVFELAKTGCWGEAVRQRKPFLNNDYQAENEHKRGIPEGHIQLERFLTVPIFSRNEIIAVVGVANKDEDYTQFDLHQLTLLMDNIWKVVQREEALQELVKAKERAEKSDRLKSAFLANMSHEIRSPMNAIVGFAGFLSDPDLPLEDRVRFSEIIQSKSDDLARLINDLLDISRIESGNATVLIEQFSLNDVIDELESVFRQKLIRLGRTSLNLMTEKPLSGILSSILSDKYIIKQVFSNLIENAIKFTETGNIRFGYYLPATGKLTCFVSDTGIGIAPEIHEVIFHHFRQGDIRDSHKYGGTGLGLAICKGATELLGGTIRVESVPGEGSTFLFTIPFTSVFNAEKSQTANLPAQNQPLVYNWPGKKILLVEDEYANMEFLKIILSRTGAELFMAFDGDQTRSYYQQIGQLDLVLLDIRLPDVSGWELALEMKKLRPDLPLIAQTAFAMSSDKQKSIEAGCDKYITKPINREMLLKTIAEVI
jgi:PAS domain S-box-containing protein